MYYNDVLLCYEVSEVADFPNVVYVLVMDREIVRSALSEVHNIDGNEYLEKLYCMDIFECFSDI